MRIYRCFFPVCFVLIAAFISGCKKDHDKGCISAQVIHLGGGSTDPCQGNIARLLQDVNEIPKGTNVLLISDQTPFDFKGGETIFFRLKVRVQLIPMPGCNLNPEYMFQINFCN